MIDQFEVSEEVRKTFLEDADIMSAAQKRLFEGLKVEFEEKTILKALSKQEIERGDSRYENIILMNVSRA